MPVTILSLWATISWKSGFRVLSDLSSLGKMCKHSHRHVMMHAGVIWSIHHFLDISIPIWMWSCWNYQNIDIKPYAKFDTSVVWLGFFCCCHQPGPSGPSIKSDTGRGNSLQLKKDRFRDCRKRATGVEGYWREYSESSNTSRTSPNAGNQQHRMRRENWAQSRRPVTPCASIPSKRGIRQILERDILQKLHYKLLLICAMSGMAILFSIHLLGSVCVYLIGWYFWKVWTVHGEVFVWHLAEWHRFSVNEWYL